MAKKITKEEYEKQQESKRKTQAKPEYIERKEDKIKLVSLIANVILIGLIICILIANNSLQAKNKKEIKSQKEQIEELKYDSDNLKELLGDKDLSYIEDKLDFIDQHIVFQIEGYGKYYYTYDCMIKKVGDKEFEFLAHNEEFAKMEGLKKGSC